LLIPVLLVGGGGSRLWPMSTPLTPKQFITLTGERSLMAATLERVSAGTGSDAGAEFSDPLIVGSRRHRQRITDELARAGIGRASIILEPCPRNTAPAIAAAALLLAETNGDETMMLVLPSDHHIADVSAFHRAVAAAEAPARAGRLVTFGIRPTRAETGYGYIKRGRAEGAAFAVDRFVEKPAPDVARRYVASGDYDWNAGIFMFRAGTAIAALAALAPDVLERAREALAGGAREGGTIVLDRNAFERAPAQSIDDAVMALSDNVAVVPVDMGWSDVGSWEAIGAIAAGDGNGNAARGRVIAEGVRDCLIYTDGGVTAAIGVSGLAIVRSGAAVLVTSLDRAQQVRTVQARVASLSQARAPAEGALDEFAAAAARLRAWMHERALPLWSEHGWDAQSGAFRELLGMDGNPCAEPFRRIRVQARQIYVFAAAHLLGWDGPALDIAWRGYEHLTARGWQVGGGWAHKLDCDGKVIDGMRDAYDHAFILLALAWLHRATGEPEPLVWAERTLAWIDAVLVDPVHGGYRESVPDVVPRRANPHMHLLEALLALFDATRDFAYLDRADRLVRLFRERFFDDGSASLREFFSAEWAPAAAEAGRQREPGHHFEWAWLLDAHEARLGGDCDAEIAALTAFADSHGTNPVTGLVHDVVDESGATISTTHRLWCQTEAIRTRLVLAARGRAGEAGKAAQLADKVFHFHLATRPEGLWNDCVNLAGRPTDSAVPASSLYHLMTLMWEIESRFTAMGTTV
jgi:mannose-1-phosphate guanylyltransferase/mannose-6-phosphate isomerase